MPQSHPNPYVGPSAFRDGDPLYGRERERARILDLLMAQRIVLLYSPSGAGKTSLIQAALIPALREEEFLVLPIIRVGSGLEPDQDLPPKTNPYVLSTLLSLEESSEQQRSVIELANMDLITYLDQRLDENSEMDEQVLIFDQFEEILTLDPIDQKAKKEFFTQLGKALRSRNRWALFAMREEFLAGLDPYLHFIPTQLQTTFRLELLQEKAAREAIQMPAQNAKIPFTKEAANKLIGDLSQVWVQQVEGSREKKPGMYIEPVQLQVVCHQLWEKLPSDVQQIDKAHVKKFANVDRALARYYASRVWNVFQKTKESERSIREWFEFQLITKQGFRGQVLKEADRSHGLNNGAIKLLEEDHLVRAEKRLNAIWYELTHDRLLEPIRTNNAGWFQENLSALQHQAEIWEKERRPDSFLLRGKALTEAEIWAKTTDEELMPVEKEFLIKSQEARATAEHKQKQTRRIHCLAIVSTIVSVIALIAFWVAFSFFSQSRQAEKVAVKAKDEAEERRKEAERLRYVSLAQALAAQSLNRQDDIGVLLARQAYLFNKKNHGHIIGQVDHALRRILNTLSFKHTIDNYESEPDSIIIPVIVSPDGQVLAAGSSDGSIGIWNLQNPAEKPLMLRDHTDRVLSLAFSPAGKFLASGSDDGTVRLWNLQNSNDTPHILGEDMGGNLCLAFSSDGQKLAAGSDDAAIRVWDLQNPDSKPIILSGHQRTVRTIAFSPNGNTLASSDAYDNFVRLWDLQNPQAKPQILSDNEEKIFSLAFSPSGERLASASHDGVIRLWNWRRADLDPVILRGHEKMIVSVAFNPDGKSLISGAYDNTVRLWDMETPDSEPAVFPIHGGVLRSVGFQTDEQPIALGASGRIVQLWELNAPSALPEQLHGHQGTVWSLAFNSKEDEILASGDDDGTVRLWNLNQSDTQRTLGSHLLGVSSVEFCQEGQILASGGRDATIKLWDMQNHGELLDTLKGHEFGVNAVACSPNGKILASGSDDHTIRLWDLKNPGTVIATLRGHTDDVNSIAFSRDGSLLASGSDDHTIRLWDLQKSETVITTLQNHKNGVNSVAFSPDGSLLASGSDDQTILLWNMAAPGNPIPLHGHAEAIFSVAFSSDGRLLASTGQDRTIRLWNVEAPEDAPIVLQVPKRHGASLAVQFGPANQILASGSQDGTILMWELTESLAKNVCKKVWRNLTSDEWRQFIGADIPHNHSCEQVALKPKKEN